MLHLSLTRVVVVLVLMATLALMMGCAGTPSRILCEPDTGRAKVAVTTMGVTSLGEVAGADSVCAKPLR